MKTVLITRPERQAIKFQSLLGEIESIILSPLEILPLNLSEEDQVDIAESCISGAWSLFTSANSVSSVAPYLLGRVLIAAVGEETSMELKSNGLPVSFIPKEKSGQGLVQEFCQYLGESLKGQVVNVFQGTSASQDVSECLRSYGAKVNKYLVYSVKEVGFEDLSLLEVLRFINEVDERNIVMTFFSGKTIRSFTKLLPDIVALSRRENMIQAIMTEFPVVVIGDKTREVALDVGFKNVLESESKQSDSMITLLKNLVLPT